MSMKNAAVVQIAELKKTNFEVVPIVKLKKTISNGLLQPKLELLFSSSSSFLFIYLFFL